MAAREDPEQGAERRGPWRRTAGIAGALGIVALAYCGGILTGVERHAPYESFQAARVWAADSLGLGFLRPSVREGRFKRRRESRADALKRMTTLGYLNTTRASGDGLGVVLDETRGDDRVFYVSGHEPGATLMRLDGTVEHTWSATYESIFDRRAPEGSEITLGYWRRAHLVPGGDVVGVFDYGGAFRVDRESEVVWAAWGRYHHQIVPVARPGADGVAWVTLRRERRELRYIDPHAPVLDDYVAWLDDAGNEVRAVSILEAVRGSDYRSLLNRAVGHEDILHTNTITELDGRHAARSPAFAAGNLLLSLRNLDAVVILDPAAEKVVWSLVGPWTAQHESYLLDSGSLLVFDNLGAGKFSKVIELDPLTQEVRWRYRGNASNGFSSDCCGGLQRLASGNTLVTASDAGFAFEVRPDGTHVWEFHSPHRVEVDGDEGPEESVATLFDVRRVPRDILAPVGETADATDAATGDSTGDGVADR